eukprot:CAMPEP_0201715000 /NCGR_PEP_ID=MMETSP0593-20130828/1260_1 /ASSEMBLY_ACC=CAM_ASM_000672 /TAXON_ID=267983 /ORGANISM="Skeletonema japonicum, Strain CCMP2506" /LENGTH=148 /DNA_ID=CAMNT_0048204345 /DNA_START=64 /DNA_END=510 /DNA_ORIENTATION=-
MTPSLRTISTIAAAIAAVLSQAAAQEEQERNFHKRHIPHRPDRPSIREQVTQKHANRRLHLERHLSELKSTISEHTFGRKLLSDEDYNRHLKFVQGLHRKLAALEEKDPRIAQLEIEEEIELQDKMLQGEFLWDMERGELVLKDDLQV